MTDVNSNSNKPKQLKTDTRQWTSGRVRFAVIGWEDRPEDNYIVFEKNFFGKNKTPDQKFNLRLRDWKNLKKLIDIDLRPFSNWDLTAPELDQKGLSKLISQSPDLFEKLLLNPNIVKLSDASLESLDRIAIRLYEVKTDRIDLIFKEIAKASGKDIERFGTLLEDLRLNQVSTMASLVYQKLKVIDLLDRTCANPKNRERDVHDIFDKNPWLMGKGYDIVQSDQQLSKYVDSQTRVDPDLQKRPDLILKSIPNTRDIVLVELKAPGVSLKARHIGQVLEYKALIQRNKPNVQEIYCFVFGYEKSPSFVASKDATLKTFSELAAELRSEYREYAKIVKGAQEDLDDLAF
jgi:hypothetical protein